MRRILPALLFLAIFGLCQPLSEKTVRWCAISQSEAQKCSKLQKMMVKVSGNPISCVKRASSLRCIQAIAAEKADAMTLDSSLLFDAGLAPYKLRPVAAEVYGTKDKPQTHYYAVAVVRNSSNFNLSQLRGLKTCHTGIGKSAGWTVPIGTLRPLLDWAGPPAPVEEAVSKFFSKSCVPGADKKRFPNLCSLCAGKGANKCVSSSKEPYSGYSGAFKCLRDNAGDVAFTRESTIFENLPDKAERDQYKLLCPDNTWKPVDKYKECHLAQVPSHAVVARSVNGREDDIWAVLSQAQEKFGENKSSEFKLFGPYAGKKDLLFKDSAIGFERIPSKIDYRLYLGFNYFHSIQNLKQKKQDSEARRTQIVWCAVGNEEQLKCEKWSRVSNGRVACSSSLSTEDCITSVMKGDADAMSLDGGLIYIAGKCGLVPVLAENQKSSKSSGSDCVNRPAEGYFAVAAVRKSDAGFTWNSLKGKKSCHTAVDRTAGWNIPIGLIANRTGSCKFGEFFDQSCAPGSDPKSNLCALCVGDENGENKCAANSRERYFGYTGAFRCLAEKAGNVAFLKDSTVLQNTDVLFGRNGSRCPREFCLFQSKTKNLLFNDNTECLAKLHGKTTYEKYLGEKYVTATANLKRCSSSPLLEACAFLMK
uniref:Lactotransferrin n=1 Tax=Nannospalax galili TaxID=1026970 RepID=A0A8C6RXP3_NANGA